MNKLNPLHFFKCIADDTRLKTILLIAHEDELCVCELVAALDVSQPKISRHLAVLRQCGLLADRKQNQWVFYSLNKSLPDWAKDVITKTLHATPTFYEYQLQRLKYEVQADDNSFSVAKHTVKVTNNKSIAETDWSQCDVVIEASGKMKTTELLNAGESVLSSCN